MLEVLGDAGAAEMAAHKLHRGTLLFGGARDPAPGPEAGPSAMAARLPPFYPLEGELSGGSPPPPPPRTKWTRRVPHPVLIGHAASLTQY